MPGLSGGERRLLALGVGLLAGAAYSAWSASRPRPAPGTAETVPPLINWDRVRTVALALNRDGALEYSKVQTLTEYYSDLVARCVPLISDYTGQQLPPGAQQVHVFGRTDWVRANIENFRRLFQAIEDMNQRQGGLMSMPGAVAWNTVNQTVLSIELGILLGYLARRVLGQYDLALLGKEPVDAGKVYFVEPNILAVQHQLDLPGDDFRTWVALHETTHAFEFEAHPWLQQRFNELLSNYFRLLEEDLGQLKRGMDAVRILIERVRAGRATGERWIAAIMTPEQRAIFNELQAIMCILEGYSNYVMNGIGRTLLPSYDLISQRLAQRQKERGLAEQIFIRLTGLNMKLEQYILGERFIDAVVERRGREFVERLWTGPETMPTMAEIRDPDVWITRMETAGTP